MDNFWPYCGLADAVLSTSEKKLPVPSTFTLLDSPAGTGFGSNSNNGSNNGHYNNGVTEDFSQQKNVQLLFLCMEEPITENTLFATTLPTHGEFYIILDIIKV